MAITSAAATSIASLYIGFYDRAPDPVGLDYWVGRLADGVSLTDIAESFAASPEAAQTYPYILTPNLFTPDQMIEQVYMNVLGRAPDADGLAYYADRLESGESVGSVLASIIGNAATNSDGAFPDQGILANKVEVGLSWAEQAAFHTGAVYEADGVTLTTDASASAHGVIDGVDETEASVTEANGEISGYFGVGNTFTLTTDIGEIVTGTALGDTFNVISGTDATLNAFDHIDGGAGIDTLNLITDDAAGGLPTAAQMVNVESINAQLAAAVLAIDSSALVDVTSLSVAGDLSGLAAVTLGASQSLTLGTSTVAPAALTVTVDAEEVATTIHLADATTATDITLVGAANTTLDVEGSVAGVGATLTVNAAATTETVDLGLSSDTIVTVTGGAVTTIDASASTGDLGLTATLTTETVLGGSGADTIAEGAAGTLVQGGAGADLITLDAAAASDVVINLGDSGITAATVDQISGFTVASDHLDFNLEAGSATNFLDGGVASSFIDALTNANTAFGADADLQYYVSNDAANTFVFVDADHNGSVDMAVQVTGVVALTDVNFIA